MVRKMKSTVVQSLPAVNPDEQTGRVISTLYKIVKILVHYMLGLFITAIIVFLN